MSKRVEEMAQPLYLPKRIKIRTGALLLLAVCPLLLCGCSIKSFAEQSILNSSGIMEDEDYQSYLTYSEEGLLDEDGYYDSPDWNLDTASQEASGSIPVTFADNSFFWINYYKDAGMKQLIDPLDFRVDPGDEIYAAEPLNYNTISDLYRLAGYRIDVYDDKGTLINSTMQAVSDDGLIIKIPNSYTGTEISILPIGEYPMRELKFSVYYIDDTGDRHELTRAGTWSVNGKRFPGAAGSVSSMDSYTAVFDFDDEKYFYRTASPTPHSVQMQGGGIVTFEEIKPAEGITDFSVELHPCLSMNLWFAAGGRVSVNGQDPEIIFSNENWQADNLKFGDTITVVSDGSVSLTGNGRHVEAERVVNGEDVRYVLTIVPGEGNAGSFPEGLGTRMRGN